MLNNITQIFLPSSIQTVRKYQPKPRLAKKFNVIQKLKSKRLKRDIKIFQGILDFLASPIDHWIAQYEKVFQNYALHQWIYNQIISFSTSFKEKLSAAERQNQIVQQLIAQIRQQHSMSKPNFRKPKISLHNAFVLMTQYKLMEKIIYDLNTQEFQMMIDGLSYIYFYGVGKEQNIGEVLSQQQILYGAGGWGTIDQLTCCIHFITTHTKFYKTYPQKEKYSLMKQIQILKMPNFVRVYDCLQENKKIDNIVNSIPMFMEFLQIFIKHKNNTIAGCQFVMNIKWLSGLGFRIMQIIQYNINKLIFLNLDAKQDLSAEQLELISQLQNLNEQNQKQQSQIVIKLTQKALLLKQTQGSINLRVLFSYCYHHLYTVNFMIKLAKKVIQLSKSHYKVYKETCQNVCKFLHKLFQSVYKYQFILPEPAVLQICQIIKLISNQGEYVFGDQQKQVRGFDYLYSKQINSIQLRQFSRNLQHSKRFGYYFNKKLRPNIRGYDDIFSEQVTQDFNVNLQQNQESIFYFILSSIYHMSLDYLQIIYTVLKYADKRYLSNLQYFFIKNQLLHFLIEQQHQIQLKDKKHIKVVLNCISYLIKGNLVAYSITNLIIIEQFDEQRNKNYFLQDLKKHFAQSPELIKVILSDAITANSTNKSLQLKFLPQILQKLLYSPDQINQSYTVSKHEIWISYISNVILHELFSYKKKIVQIQKKRNKNDIPSYVNIVESFIQQNKFEKYPFEKQIYDWITLIILLHIDYVQSKKFQGKFLFNFITEHDQQILLAHFVMTYLSTILTQAIKWKYKNQNERMVQFLKMLEDWETYYTNMILNQENNEDVLQKEYGGCINFLFLKRWNKKIIKSIHMYLQTMEEYNIERKLKRKSLQKTRNLQRIRSFKNINLV